MMQQSDSNLIILLPTTIEETQKKSSKQYFAAIIDYDAAIRLKPDFASALANRGIVKYNLGQDAAAIVDYDKSNSS